MAGCWERWPLRLDAYRLGDLIFRQAFRLGEVRGARLLRLDAHRLGDLIFRQALRPGEGLGATAVAP